MQSRVTINDSGVIGKVTALARQTRRSLEDVLSELICLAAENLPEAEPIVRVTPASTRETALMRRTEAIRELLQATPSGLTILELQTLLKCARQPIVDALGPLLARGNVVVEELPTGGRPANLYRLVQPAAPEV